MIQINSKPIDTFRVIVHMPTDSELVCDDRLKRLSNVLRALSELSVLRLDVELNIEDK